VLYGIHTYALHSGLELGLVVWRARPVRTKQFDLIELLRECVVNFLSGLVIWIPYTIRGDNQILPVALDFNFSDLGVVADDAVFDSTNLL